MDIKKVRSKTVAKMLSELETFTKDPVSREWLMEKRASGMSYEDISREVERVTGKRMSWSVVYRRLGHYHYVPKAKRKDD